MKILLSNIGINVWSIEIIVFLPILHSVFQPPPPPQQLVSEENHGQNKVSNATQQAMIYG